MSGGDIIQTFDEHINVLVSEGYIDKESGNPLKCLWCDSKNLTSKNEYYENHSIIEYDMACKDCGKITGHWSYGNWQC